MVEPQEPQMVEPQEPRPNFAVIEGMQEWEKWKSVTGIEDWCHPICLDKHGVIDRIHEFDQAADLYHQLRSIPKMKFLVVSHIVNEHNAVYAFDWKQPWSYLLHRADGIIFTLHRHVHGKGLRVWCPQNKVGSWHYVGFRNVILCDGDKGQILSALGMPVLMIDDRPDLLEGVMRHAGPLSHVIHVPAEGRTVDPKYRGLYPTITDVLEWIIEANTWVSRVESLGWGDRDGILALRATRSIQRAEAERNESVRCALVRVESRSNNKEFFFNDITRQAPEVSHPAQSSLDQPEVVATMPTSEPVCDIARGSAHTRVSQQEDWVKRLGDNRCLNKERRRHAPGRGCGHGQEDCPASQAEVSHGCDKELPGAEKEFSVGEPVSCLFDGGWHPAKVRAVGVEGGMIEVLWCEEWSISILPQDHVKHR